MENVKLSINGMDFEVPSNYTVLEAAKEAGIHIPTLCYLKDLNEVGACVCVLSKLKGRVHFKLHVFCLFARAWSLRQTPSVFVRHKNDNRTPACKP